MAKDQFSLDVNEFAKSFNEGAERAVRSVAGKTFASVIQRSPVMEGRFRANWFATGKKPSTKTTNNTDTSKDGTTTANQAEFALTQIKDWSEFKLTNNLPYAQVLEFGLYNQGPSTVMGYSSQAVGGMVRISILKSNMLLEQEAKKFLPK